MAHKLLIEEVNELGYEEFIEHFKNAVEHGMLISGAVWACRPFSSRDHLHQNLCDFMDALPTHGRQSVLRCHPNLAGKLARQGKLTAESEHEQAGAGLSSLTDDQFNTITKYNDIYRAKFGFPFVICARENKVNAILNGLVSRCKNSAEQELQTGIEEVKKICHYRLLDLVAEERGHASQL